MIYFLWIISLVITGVFTYHYAYDLGWNQGYNDLCDDNVNIHTNNKKEELL